MVTVFQSCQFSQKFICFGSRTAPVIGPGLHADVTYIVASGLGMSFSLGFGEICTNSKFISKRMKMSRKKTKACETLLRVSFFTQFVYLLLLDHLRSQDRCIILSLFASCQVYRPVVGCICIKLLPGTPAWNVSSAPLLNEQFPSPQRPSVPFLSHTQPCLACGTRVSSLSCTWFLFGCQYSELLLAAIARGLFTSKLVLMSAQHKHKYIRKRCMG